MSDTQLLTAQEGVSVVAEGLPVLGDKPSTPGPGVTALGQLQPGQLPKERRTVKQTIAQQPDAETMGPVSRPARGITRVLRDVGTLVGRGMCRLGIHRGPWVFSHEGNCAQLRACARCGTTDTRTRHKREWRYAGESTCRQQRVCGRCDASDKDRTRHEKWGASYSAGPDTQAHRCQRCRTVETWDTSSDYSY